MCMLCVTRVYDCSTEVVTKVTYLAFSSRYAVSLSSVLMRSSSLSPAGWRVLHVLGDSVLWLALCVC